MTFSIQKRIQLLKKVRLSTDIDILEEKNKIYLEGGQKSQKKFFSMNNVKIADKFIYEIKINEK